MEIRFTKESVKYVNKLDKLAKLRLQRAFDKLSVEPPQGDIKPLQGEENIYRLRIGNLRVMFTIKDDVILVNRIAPRGGAYK